MKTRILITSLLAAVTTSAHAASPATFSHRDHAAESRRAAPVIHREVTGVLPRVLRDDHPLEMLNPFAPAKYGTAEQNVSLNPDVPGQGAGIKLFSITF